MSNAELTKYRSKLEQLAQRVRDDATAAAEETTSAEQTAGELSSLPTHPGDRGTEEYLSEINTTLVENEQYIVDEARGALQRIEAGTYGVCEACGQEIPRERLDAIPYTRFCASCAEKYETPPMPTDL